VPELPEVETVVRDLRLHLVGRRIASVEWDGFALRRPWTPGWAALLAGRRVRAVARRGKWIVADLGGGSQLVFHLGMTGQLLVSPARQPRRPHTHLVVGLDRRLELRFRDVRRFGSATLFPSAGAVATFFAEAGLGPEPFDLEPGYWRHCLCRTSRVLKAVLLDQRVVAGVGNIYADEALFAARLHPARVCREVRPAEAERLRRALGTVLTQAIEQRGSSIRDFIGGSGQKGRFQEEHAAYGRTGQPCRRCRTAIACIRLAGRSTHYCPRCQRL
jgi:formamidopyrimidine-DNA glycosylase